MTAGESYTPFIDYATDWMHAYAYVDYNRDGEFTNVLESDGQIGIADVTALVNILLGKDDAVPHEYDHAAADVNNDGSTSIADVTELVNMILGK